MPGDLGVDGAFVAPNGKTVLVEVKLTRGRGLGETTGRVINLFGRLQRALGGSLSFIVFALVLVGVPKEQQSRFIEQINERLSSAQIPVRLRVYDYAELKKKYGVVS